MTSHLKESPEHLVDWIYCYDKSVHLNCLLCIQSLADFTILYPKHKHLVQNEFPHDAKTLGPISNSRQVFSKK